MIIIIILLLVAIELFIEKKLFDKYGKIKHWIKVAIYLFIAYVAYQEGFVDGKDIICAVGIRMLLYDSLFATIVLHKDIFYIGESTFFDELRIKLNLVGWPGFCMKFILSLGAITNYYIPYINF